VKARSINVNTKNGTVTLRGVVRSVDEHDRALTLARDTVGVTQVVDELRVEAQ
jgi:osmotically-inducible protein OsmY